MPRPPRSTILEHCITKHYFSLIQSSFCQERLMHDTSLLWGSQHQSTLPRENQARRCFPARKSKTAFSYRNHFSLGSSTSLATACSIARERKRRRRAVGSRGQTSGSLSNHSPIIVCWYLEVDSNGQLFDTRCSSLGTG